MATHKITDYQKKISLPELEHTLLDYWDQIKAFELSVSERDASKSYVFYDGPPFATGLPHYGHILASTIKDVIPRYWTMKGYRVERVWGWDCHGIPIENIIEKELNLKGGKKGIEELGIDRFNAACRSTIMRFDKEWEKVIRRIGRWVDFKNSYKTMDNSYMESVWWAFKTLNDKGFVYEGKKVILYCPRCATPLSNFEIAMDNSYKEVEDNSVYVLFQSKAAPNEYFMAWTTTPWTLIGNVALAVSPSAKYVKVSIGDKVVWLAETLASKVLQEEDWQVKVLETATGEQLVGKEYEPLYTYMPLEGKKAYYIVSADFVSLEEGTGIVHTAAIFGEDDYKLALAKNLPCVPTLDDQGRYLDFVTPLSGIFYKKSEQWVVDDLISRDLMFRAEKIVHSYPFCYRCETPLYYNAVPAWFINVQTLKPELITQNKTINWYPDHLKLGRFGKGLETAPDWNISRSRYWGTPMPVWVGEKTGKKRIIGSVAELKQWAVDPTVVDNLHDLHREFIDGLDVWVDDEKTEKGRRIPEVFDCWVESGSMPYASIHYPFHNKERFEQSHPAQFIAEYIAQTRAWFYTLHVMSVGLFGKATFENAVTTGTILAEDGTKMSKSKKNYPDPTVLFEKYGVDALRFYLMGSVVMKAENVNFSEAQVKEIYQKLINTFWNVFSFYKLFADPKLQVKDKPKAEHVLDRWVVSKTERLVKEATAALDKYDTVTYCRIVQEFVTELSTWYVRRSRDRIRTDSTSQHVLGWVIHTACVVLAPIMPFITELVFTNLHDDARSVHLEFWPTANEDLIDDKLERSMELARTIVECGHAVRKAEGVKVRQPLAALSIALDSDVQRLPEEFDELLKEELNVKQVDWAKSKTKKANELPENAVQDKVVVSYDLELTPELVAEGESRELIRQIQTIRKEMGCRMDQRISLQLPKRHNTLAESFLKQIATETLADKITWGDTLEVLTG